MKKRVVITGMGVVSPIGVGLSLFRKSLQEGFSGQAPIRQFDTTNHPVKNAFEVKNFEARKHGTHLLDPFIQFAVAAAGEAVQMSGVELNQVDPYRIGISVSSSKGGVHTIDRFKERFSRSPSAILGARIYANSVPNFGAQWIARRWNVQGPARCYVAACATGTVAIVEGARMIEEGLVDYCIAGSSDASITPLMLGGYRSMKALAKGAMLPFDSRRSGFLVGEGAGIVLLETHENAKARGAKIYGEILGSSYAFDGANLIHFQEKENGLYRALSELMKKTNAQPLDFGYLNLHGTATRVGDIYETNQIKKAFGAKAQQIPMSSTKSMTGHMLGAAGSVEIIASLVAMQEGFLPPTINLEKPDPQCDLDYVAKCSRAKKIDRAISVSLGFGGHIAVIALGKG